MFMFMERLAKQISALEEAVGSCKKLADVGSTPDII